MKTHNPANLTPEQVGAEGGWRLLDKDEIGHFNKDIEGLERWDSGWEDGPWAGTSNSRSYRTKLTRAELRAARGLPPKELSEVEALKLELQYAKEAATKSAKEAAELRESLSIAMGSERILAQCLGATAEALGLDLNTFDPPLIVIRTRENVQELTRLRAQLSGEQPTKKSAMEELWSMWPEPASEAAPANVQSVADAAARESELLKGLYRFAYERGYHDGGLARFRPSAAWEEDATYALAKFWMRSLATIPEAPKSSNAADPWAKWEEPGWRWVEAGEVIEEGDEWIDLTVGVWGQNDAVGYKLCDDMKDMRLRRKLPYPAKPAEFVPGDLLKSPYDLVIEYRSGGQYAFAGIVRSKGQSSWTVGEKCNSFRWDDLTRIGNNANVPECHKAMHAEWLAKGKPQMEYWSTSTDSWERCDPCGPQWSNTLKYRFAQPKPEPTEDEKRVAENKRIMEAVPVDETEYRWRREDGSWAEWETNADWLFIDDPDFEFRRKPTPTYAPWTQATCPLGAAVRHKETGRESLITGKDAKGVKLASVELTYAQLLESCELADGKPCGDAV